MMTAKGTFEVNISPQENFQGIGRAMLSKRYSGDLEGVAEGAMLTFGSPADGSAAYVAIERVEGMLNGRRGSFALAHRGIMRPGAQDLSITVVPDSGTEGLAGISGEMSLEVEGGKHFYSLNYQLY